MSEEKIYDVVVVGGGPSGIAAAYHCTRTRLNTCWVDLHCELYGGGGVAVGPDPVPGYYLVKRRRKIRELREEDDYQLDVKPSDRIQDLKLDSTVKAIITPQSKIQGQVVIFATTVPRNKLAIENEEQYASNGGLYYKVPANVDFRGKHVVVLGDGAWAVRNALYLDEKGAKVSLVSCCQIGKLHNALENKLEVSFIEVFEKYKPTKFEGSEGELDSITFDIKGRKMKIDDVDMAISTGCSCASANVLEAAGVPLNDTGKIITISDKGQTAFQGVYAVGFATQDNIPIGALDIIGERVAVQARKCLENLKHKDT